MRVVVVLGAGRTLRSMVVLVHVVDCLILEFLSWGTIRSSLVRLYIRLRIGSKVLIPSRGMLFMRSRGILGPRKISGLLPGKDIGVVVVLGGGTPGHNSDGGHSSLHSQGLERSQSKDRHSGGLMLDTVGTWVVESKACALSTTATLTPPPTSLPTGLSFFVPKYFETQLLLVIQYTITRPLPHLLPHSPGGSTVH